MTESGYSLTSTTVLILVSVVALMSLLPLTLTPAAAHVPDRRQAQAACRVLLASLYAQHIVSIRLHVPPSTLR